MRRASRWLAHFRVLGGLLRSRFSAWCLPVGHVQHLSSHRWVGGAAASFPVDDVLVPSPATLPSSNRVSVRGRVAGQANASGRGCREAMRSSSNRADRSTTSLCEASKLQATSRAPGHAATASASNSLRDERPNRRIKSNTVPAQMWGWSTRCADDRGVAAVGQIGGNEFLKGGIGAGWPAVQRWAGAWRRCSRLRQDAIALGLVAEGCRLLRRGPVALVEEHLEVGAVEAEDGARVAITAATGFDGVVLADPDRLGALIAKQGSEKSVRGAVVG